MARVTLTPAEHARADAFAMWIRADRESEQLDLLASNTGAISAPLDTIGGRKEWARAALTAGPVSTPTTDRSSYGRP